MDSSRNRGAKFRSNTYGKVREDAANLIQMVGFDSAARDGATGSR